MKKTFLFKVILGLFLLISNTSFAIDPPVIRTVVTGNQIYCAGSFLNIVPSVTITFDPTDPEVYSIYIQISSGYINGQDQLTLNNASSHPSISAIPFDLNTGILKLTSKSGSNVSSSDFEAAIKDVQYNNSSPFPSGKRTFSISIGTNRLLSYLPRNKHFYEYVPAIGITWSDASVAAAAKTYYGLQGYLATLTAADEATLAGEQAPGTGWIGGSDAATEGVWKWVTGPEGLANGGTGITFWNGLANGSTPNFAFWNTGEPNQSNGTQEDYAHVTAPGVGIKGSWNDLTNTGNSSGNYQPKGYIVEYGGMIPGDVDSIQISTSTSITIPKITSTTPSSTCGSGAVTLQATATDGNVDWYETPTGGTKFFTGNSFITPILTTSKSYYVDASNGSCSLRTEIIATITPLPSLPQIAVSSTSPVLYCLNAIAIPLAAIASTDCKLNWYTLPMGGIATATNPTPSTTVAGSTTYYVSQTNTISGCESPRAAIIVTVNPLPSAPIVSNVNYCNNETTVPLTASASANCTLNWYTNSTEGTSSATPPTPSTANIGSTNYYVSQTITSTGCEGPRAVISVTINPLPTAPIVSNIAYCHNEIAIPLTATASTNCILNWYTNSTGGTSSAMNPTPSTVSVGITKYYVSQTVTVTGCEGPRSEIIVTVNPLPVVNDVTIIQCDSDLIVDGKTLFNLTVNNTSISANSTNETFTYYTSLNGANNAVPADLIPNNLDFENTTPTAMDVWSRITNKITGCHSVAKIILKVPATNISPNYKITFPPVCDDFLDVNGNNTANNNNRDGITAFDFSATKADVIAQLPTSQAYNINYYRNESDALAETNVITNISNYRNIGYPNSQDIWIRIDSDLDNACYGLGPYLTLNVGALPNIDLNLDGDDDNLVCQNNPTFYIQLNAGIQDGTPTTNYTYIWTKDGTIIPGETDYTLNVNTEGLFTVKVENSLGCSNIRTIKVTASDVAKIDSIDIQDMSDINTVKVNVSTSSLGDYEYSLDDRLGPFQNSNFFNNVSAGIHEVFVNDKNGCGPITQATIAVVGAPKFFTPNNDGYNDYWSVKGVNQTYNSKSIIYIFDRYGKLLKQWVPTLNQGWDGTFNGVPLPADDYWFTLKLEDGREAKGHFSLKR
jgi:gliding motility-associated-like protein